MTTLSSVETKIKQAANNGQLPAHTHSILKEFWKTYKQSAKDPLRAERLFEPLIEKVIGHCKNPFCFPSHHQGALEQEELYSWGLDFWAEPMDLDRSKLHGEASIHRIKGQVEMGHNVILFGNHQTEPDPQAVSLLTMKHAPEVAKKMVFVAGDRVITDPVAIPFSMGRNLLCIYSKRHIAHPPEKREEKQLHNKKTMRIMGEMLAEGGHCIYVAPSGGRDRKDKEGRPQVAPFDAQSVEMFHLMTKRSGTPTHFYPLSLFTYHILPPPDTIDVAVGERRLVGSGPVGLCFGEELDMETIGDPTLGKKEQRAAKTAKIEAAVRAGYARISQ